MKIQFHGASREVTGSCYVLEADGVRSSRFFLAAQQLVQL